jgi:hypothetical protein
LAADSKRSKHNNGVASSAKKHDSKSNGATGGKLSLKDHWNKVVSNYESSKPKPDVAATSSKKSLSDKKTSPVKKGLPHKTPNQLLAERENKRFEHVL